MQSLVFITTIVPIVKCVMSSVTPVTEQNRSYIVHTLIPTRLCRCSRWFFRLTHLDISSLLLRFRFVCTPFCVV